MTAVLEPWQEKVKRWTAPISEASPSGTPAREDSRYESLAQEISKLDSPAAPPVTWPAVVEIAGAILSERSKDILIASYLSFGLSRTRGLDGLTCGMVLLSTLMERYWDSLYPELKRLRGRAAALTWFIGKVSGALPGTPVSPADRALLRDLDTAARHLAQVSREKLESNAPSFGQVIEQIQRLQLSLPPEQPAASAPAPAPPVAPPPAASAASAPAVTPAPPPPPATVPPPPSAPAVAIAQPQIAAFAAGADTVRYLLPVGKSLLETASLLRKASTCDPTAYRLLRAGIWMHICEAPPIDPSGKTRERPLPPELRQQCERMIGQGAWPQLLETAETVLTNCRLLLDPHRYVAQALAGLGNAHAAARQTVLAELGAFLRRFPALVDASASDGSPLADNATKEWLQAEVLAGAGGGTGKPAESGDLSPEESAARDGKELAVAGKVPDAIALLGRAAGGTGNARARFKLRLQIAELCVQQGELQVARGLFEALDREAQERRLADWEPALSVAVLQGFLLTVRKLGVATRGAVEPTVAPVLYDRLCLLDPSAALRLGGKPQG